MNKRLLLFGSLSQPPRLPLRKLWPILLLLAAFLASCTSEFDASVKDLDLAISKFDDGTNFADLNTFYMYDTVVYITDEEGTMLDNQHAYDAMILSNVRQNLLSRGWTELTDTSDPDNTADVTIQISALAVDAYFYYTYWWDYWYWYPWDWWYPGWGGYPYYPVYPSYPGYSYSIGTLIVDMIATDQVVVTPRADGDFVKIPIVWTGAVNGILEGSTNSISDRIEENLDQVFIQSPYLKK